MKRQPGKRRNMIDMRKRYPNAYEFPLSRQFDGEAAPFIRENCRRGDYAVYYNVPYTEARKWTTIFVFADETDAMAFKMRFN